MARQRSPEFNRILKERKEEIGKCELCGSRRGLELHHCIPLSLGGEDTDENLILLCYGCHAKLTPRSLLTRIGMNGKFPGLRYEIHEFWEHIEAEIEDGVHLSGDDVFFYLDPVLEEIYKLLRGEHNG